MSHQCHRIVTWEWNRGQTSFNEVEEDTRCDGDEPLAYSLYDSSVRQSHGEFGHPSLSDPTRWETHWPGAKVSPSQRYVVALLSWDPGQAEWQWEQQTVYDPPQPYTMSAFDQSQASEALKNISTGPTPDEKKTNAGWWIAGGAAVLGVAALLLFKR